MTTHIEVNKLRDALMGIVELLEALRNGIEEHEHRTSGDACGMNVVKHNGKYARLFDDDLEDSVWGAFISDGEDGPLKEKE